MPIPAGAGALYIFPDPREDARATLAANAYRWPAGATWGTKPATTVGTAPHIQYGWDGTPTSDRQRERNAVRLTVWGWKTETAPGAYVWAAEDLPNLASLVQAVFLDSGGSDVWRYTPGIGRLPGVDPDSKVPFVTFTLTAETRPSPVA